uniref:Trypsin-30 n=1 Tax=Nilaparvata lugens TaxID=108931 RepID=A0A068FBC2_NILLU|nr:trypsin-30 [Nilaparvata lugens]
MCVTKLIFLISLFLLNNSLGSSFSINKQNNVEITESDHDNDGGRIVGGSNTTINKNPYQVAIIGNEAIFLGSGIIVDKHYVLTICSLVNYLITSKVNVQIRAGSTRHDKGGKMYTVEKIICNKNFSKISLDNDIALLRISSAIQFNRNVKIIKVAKTHLQPGKVVTTSGWGTLLNETDRVSFQSVNLNIVDKSACQEIYQEDEIKDSMICAHTPSKGPCWGDFGNPLVTKKPLKAYGLFSWAARCADEKYPAIFTDLVYANQFINDIIHANYAKKSSTIRQ